MLKLLNVSQFINSPKQGGSMSAEVGQPAPELTLINNERQPVTLADIKGKTTVLAFFPGAFTGGCQQEACTFRDALSEYNNLGAQVYGISVDSFFAQNAFTFILLYFYFNLNFL